MAHDKAYFEAKKKIEEARLLGARELRLDCLNLTKLPDSLAELTQLESLNLSFNQLTELPEWLERFTHLKSLDLRFNELLTLPESLGKLTQLRSLDLSRNPFMALPDSLGWLTELDCLNLSYSQLTTLPEWLGRLTQLKSLYLSGNDLTALPDWLKRLNQLESLYLLGNQLTVLPEWVGKFIQLKVIDLSSNQLTALPESFGNLILLENLKLNFNGLTDIPASLIGLKHFDEIVYYNASIRNNPLNPELAEAYKQGLKAVKTYLRAKAEAQITLNEAKLIIVGEGEVGKTCLMDALLGKPWQEHDTTHGIEIQQVKVTDAESNKEFILNGWDFGGQRVYRATHQLFFSTPAVYIIVWKPREGYQQGFVKEWIQLIKRRESSAKIIVVATHGGPQERQPDIDRQEIWDLFGRETVVDFFFIDSKPDEFGERKGIEKLRLAIARVAATLPEVGRTVPKSFADVRQALQAKGVSYMPLDEVLAICRSHNMDDEVARLFIAISHRLGHLTHYENDQTLRDIVILRPDWLASALSYVLDDKQTRAAHGLVRLSRLSQLWDDPARGAEFCYPRALHPIFLRLMERFDLCYRIANPDLKGESDPLSLIGQLVPDNRPEEALKREWPLSPATGDLQQMQICRIVDAQNGQSASAEGLFYQLIVRLHKYSLGRVHYADSIHWQHGLILDNDYNGRALLELIDNDVHITVRAPYPERFLVMLTSEVKYLVESFWEGLRCEVMVPCMTNHSGNSPCTGLFEVDKLIDSKRTKHSEFPCPVCNQWQNIDSLLLNAPAAQPDAMIVILSEFAEVKSELAKARHLLSYQGDKILGRFDRLDDRTRRILSLVDNAYHDLLQVFTDEAKEGPCLFSLVPTKRSTFNLKRWTSEKFRLILWCEHSRLPLPILNGKNSQKGVYELEFTREWFKKAAPLLEMMNTTLSLILPVAAFGTKLAMDKVIYNSLEDYLNFGKDVIDATLTVNEKTLDWMSAGDILTLEHGIATRAENATLRELHTLLKAKDPGFGGLVRVMNKHQEFLWVHEKFASEY